MHESRDNEPLPPVRTIQELIADGKLLSYVKSQKQKARKREEEEKTIEIEKRKKERKKERKGWGCTT